MNRGGPLSSSRLHRMPMALAFGATDVGPVRSTNEDNFLIDEALGLAMVADGMGGHAAGAVASAGALTALRDYLAGQVADRIISGRQLIPDPDSTWSDPAIQAVGVIHDAIEFANQRLYAQNVAHGSPDGGMGSTLTGFWSPAADALLVFFHVGDSRLYLLRGGQLSQLTRDQTVYQAAIDAGIKENLPARNLLLQAVGPTPAIVPEVHSQLALPGDVLMLCSDGLHGSVQHNEIALALAEVTEATLSQACGALVELATKNGTRDNVTVLLALYES